MDCRQCGRLLTDDEIAMHKRMINRGATSHLCLTCLAEFYQCSEDLLREKMEYFRRIGCMLFKPKEE